MRTLIVVLPMEPPTASTPLDYVLMPDKPAAAVHDRAIAALLPAAGEILALVPAQALSWHSVELPRGTLTRGALGGQASQGRLRALLEGVLEDRLLDEPDALHFALQPDAQAQAPAWVAACDRAWLRGALTLLEAANRPVARVVPELTPAADQQAQLCLIGGSDSPQLAYRGEQGVSVLPLSAAALAWAQARSGAPDSVTVVVEPALAGLAEELIARQVTLQTSTERWLAAANSSWDLAQFDLANSDRSRAWKRTADRLMSLWRAPQWRAARWALGLLLVAQLAGLNAWAWKESTALAEKRKAVNAALTNTFPGVKVVVDAPIQMERELARLRQAAGAYSQRDLEAMLGALGNALPPALAPQGIEFATGETRLSGLNLDSAAATALNTKLQPAGLRARAEADRWVIAPSGRETSP